MNNSTVHQHRRGFLLGLATGAIGGWIAGRRLAGPRRMPFLDTWQRALAEERGAVAATLFAGRVQARYEELYAGRPRFSQRALRVHLEWLILPGLALYQVLREEGRGQEEALGEAETLFEAAFGHYRGLGPLLGRLSDPFATFRSVARTVIRLAFPAEGWDMELVEDSDDCLAFNVHRCIYLEVLTTYGAPELTPLYCQSDDLLFEALPPVITWERTQTLGRGGDCCNFRWCRRTDA